MSAKWIPGPWRPDWDDNGRWYVEPLGVTGRKLCGDSGDCQERSTAYLIAAAPELYLALERAAEESDECADDTTGTPSSDYFRKRAEVARAVLAKARGEKV